MNRYKKEEKRKYDEARKGLSEDEVLAVILEDEIKKIVVDLAKSLHESRFPEEYIYMDDSYVEAKERANGINTMSSKYIEHIQKKRSSLGVAQLAENGIPVSNETYILCLKDAIKCLSLENLNETR